MSRLRLTVSPLHAPIVRIEKLTSRRRGEAALSSVPRNTDADGLRAMRGILNGLLFSCVAWLLIGCLAWLIFR
jgi:hypothetical protein